MLFSRMFYAVFPYVLCGFSCVFAVFLCRFSQKSARIFARLSALLCVRAVRGRRNFEVQ